jgi:hypothetical protein
LAEKSQKSSVTRKSLIGAGSYALSICVEKLKGRYTAKDDKLSYIRAVSSLIGSISSVMKDSELAELEERISKLEELVKSGKTHQ